MLRVVVMVKIMEVWAMITGEPRELILYWTQSLTYTLSLMFSSVRTSGTFLIYLTLSTNYLYTNYCPKKCLANISKEEISTLDGTCRRSYCSSI